MYRCKRGMLRATSPRSVHARLLSYVCSSTRLLSVFLLASIYVRCGTTTYSVAANNQSYYSYCNCCMHVQYRTTYLIVIGMCIKILINSYSGPDAHTAVYNAACTPCSLSIKFAARLLFPALPCRYVHNLGGTDWPRRKPTWEKPAQR